ncbi:MAG: hypothetical protein ABI999_13675 [Acidobacteriota bacterium]
MLPLDSPRWAELKHAYGDAADIPGLLKELENFPIDHDPLFDGPWHSVWSALAHQGDVYSASFAAIPWIVHFLSSDPPRASWDYFGLPACVEIYRMEKSVPIPPDLELDYFAALKRLPSLVEPSLMVERDEVFLRSVLSAIAASKGQHLLAKAILELNPEVAAAFLDWEEKR